MLNLFMYQEENQNFYVAQRLYEAEKTIEWRINSREDEEEEEESNGESMLPKNRMENQ
jgi:hypothetical protein